LLLGGIAQAREGGHVGGEHEGREHGAAAAHRGRHGQEGWGGWGGWYDDPASEYAAPDVPPGGATPSEDYWYYCASANVYYPSVTQCPEGWKVVAP
jgi:hypothetical protein